MTQQNNTTNWVFQGQPQVIKLVQQSGKSVSGIMTTSMSGQPVKIFKTPASSSETSQVFTSGQIIKAGQKIVTKTVPIHINSLNSLKGTKAIKLTPQQLQNIKLINPNTPQKSTSSSSLPIFQTVYTSAQLSKNISPPILSRKRQDPLELDYTPDSKRVRKSEKGNKGLRHFAMKVCEKVQDKGTTTYNEVADELVAEFTNSSSSNAIADQYDQKNIRRRVYDALNVLMAMNIISKEKKEIKWIGLPTNSLQECNQLEKEKQKKIRSIKEKEKQLTNLIVHQVAFKNLAQRNREAERINGPPPHNSYINLPFIVVDTNKDTTINCNISDNKMEYLIKFNNAFQLTSDVNILKKIGMLKGLDSGNCSEEDLNSIKELLPESLWSFVNKIASNGKNDIDEILGTNAGTSTMNFINPAEDLEITLHEDDSRQSSSDALSAGGEYSDEEVDSDSSENEIN